MGTMILKCTAILALVLAAPLKPTINLQVLLGFVMCATGMAVAAQAIRARKYVWAGVFFSIAALFNPVFPMEPVYSRHLALSAACALAFLLSLFLLHNLPKRTMALIVHQDSQSESL